MDFRIGCALDYAVPKPSVFIFNVAVARCAAHRLQREQLLLAPALTPQELVMPATGKRFTRIEVPAGHLSLRYEAQVECPAKRPQPATDTDGDVDRIRPEAIPYLFPSRYCQADLLADLARDVAGTVSPGEPQVAAICDWVFRSVRYRPGASDSSTSALDTERDRSGVCRDFAHLAIALCRALGIPARFVTGYAWGLVVPDFHACMEAYVKGRWHLFDPSRKVATDRMIRIGTGHDAADTAFATIIGDGQPSALTQMDVFAEPA
ncbi:MAG: transglutaminase family protein [Alphaproteobacteria bacterium]|nr:transglutaminase family protein [Alphaproteobacteria bacterium]